MKALSEGEMRISAEIEGKIRDILNNRLHKIFEVERRLNKYVPELANTVELNLEKKVIQSLQSEIYDVFHQDLNWINGGENEST